MFYSSLELFSLSSSASVVFCSLIRPLPSICVSVYLSINMVQIISRKSCFNIFCNLGSCVIILSSPYRVIHVVTVMSDICRNVALKQILNTVSSVWHWLKKLLWSWTTGMTYVSVLCHSWPSLTASWLFGFTQWPPALTEHEEITSCTELQSPGLFKGPLTWQHGGLYQKLFYSISLLSISPALGKD